MSRSPHFLSVLSGFLQENDIAFGGVQFRIDTRYPPSGIFSFRCSSDILRRPFFLVSFDVGLLFPTIYVFPGLLLALSGTLPKFPPLRSLETIAWDCYFPRLWLLQGKILSSLH